MKCLSCQAENKPGAKFCSSCGTTFAVATTVAAPVPGKSCGQCGHDCKADAKFCPKCAFSFAVAPLPVAVPVADVVAEAVPEPVPVPVSIPEPVASPPPPPVLEKRRADPEPVPAPVPEPEATPARVPDSVPDMPADSPTGGKRMKLIAATVTAVVLLGGAGAYYFLSGKPPAAPAEPTPTLSAQEDPASAAEQPLAISDPVLDGAATADFAATPAAAADEPTPVPEAAPAPAPELARAPVAEKPAKPVKAVPPPAPVKQTSGLESVITESLSEASHCMSQRKYDCAIANANAVLRMDKGNRYALDIKRKAKEAQDKALSQIQIE